MFTEAKTILVHPAMASLSPNNPAGIDSLLRVVNGTVGYLDLNEGLLLDWMLSGKTLSEIVETNKKSVRFNQTLTKFGIDKERVTEVVEKADLAKEAFTQLSTYTDFTQFVESKRILEDAAKIVSAPFITDSETEFLQIHHNTFGYYNSQFERSRSSLLQLTRSASLFKNFLQEQAVPQILQANPKILGISITHPDQYVFAFQLAHQIRQARPDIITLFGGSTISRRMDTWSKDDDVNKDIFRTDRSNLGGIIDGLVVSEGELALAQLTAKIVEDPNIDIRELFNDVYGAIYNKDGKITFNALPKPFYPDGLWRRKDVYANLKRGLMPDQHKMHSLVDGRVCTYECATGGCEFCAISKGYLELTQQSARRMNLTQRPVPPSALITERSLRFASEAQDGKRGIKIIEQRRLGAERMADEIAEGLKHGFSVVDITDEQFTVDQALQLTQALARRGINTSGTDVTYACYMRIDDAGDKTNYKQKYGKNLQDLLADPEIAKQLATGGMRFAQFGLETTYPPKMQAMVKGTSELKVKKFGDILKNFAENGIMPHIFVIVGYPLKENYWVYEKKFAFEEKVLSRKVDADDLEILEAITNLKFLHDHRESIFTFKHAPYELAFGSPMAERPGEFGLGVDQQAFAKTDLSCNIPYSYTAKSGPSKPVLNDIMDLYSLWKREEMPFQSVVQEFQYSQRILPELGAKKIAEMAGRLESQSDTHQDESNSLRKKEILMNLWRRLTNDGKTKNIVNELFPGGFESYEDLYFLADRVSSAFSSFS